MLNITKDLFKAFNTNQVLYCIWKGTSKIDEGLEGLSDVDLLLSAQSSDLARYLMRGLGFLQAKTQWQFRFKGIEDWLGFDSTSGRMVHIHLHYKMISGHPYTMEYSFPWSERVLNDRVLQSNNVYTISPYWEMIVFLARLGLEYPNKKIDAITGCLKQSALEEFRHIQNEIDWVLFDMVVKEIFPNSFTSICSVSRKSELSLQDFAILKKSVKELFHSGLKDCCYGIVSSLKGFVVAYLSPVVKALSWFPLKKTLPKGVMIAFLGQDGSGKSTVTQEVEKWLNWKLEVSRFYLGSGSEFYNPWRRRLLKKLNNTNFIASYLRRWLVFSDYLALSKYVWKTVSRARHYADKGGIALLDRYPQTGFPGINDGPKIRATLLDRVPKRFVRFANYYANREEYYIRKATETAPEIVFKLMLSPEESLRRKPFENAEMVQKKHEIIKHLSYPSSDVRVIDAEQSYHAEILQIKAIIWERIKG